MPIITISELLHAFQTFSIKSYRAMERSNQIEFEAAKTELKTKLAALGFDINQIDWEI